MHTYPKLHIDIIHVNTVHLVYLWLNQLVTINEVKCFQIQIFFFFCSRIACVYRH